MTAHPGMTTNKERRDRAAASHQGTTQDTLADGAKPSSESTTLTRRLIMSYFLFALITVIAAIIITQAARPTDAALVRTKIPVPQRARRSHRPARRRS